MAHKCLEHGNDEEGNLVAFSILTILVDNAALLPTNPNNTVGLNSHMPETVTIIVPWSVSAAY